MSQSAGIQSLRVLIVEHDAADAELNVHALRTAGFEVTYDVAGDAEAFRPLIRNNTYDIVLSDYRLPSWTGMEALADLRAMGIDIPFILVTGTLGDERAVECVRGGAADYVLKDNIGRLAIAVHRALDEYHARTELQRAESLTREFQLEALEREARFAQLAENISEVFYLVEADYSRTLYINKAYETIWGRTTESLYQNPTSFIEAVHPDDRAVLDAHIQQVQRGEAPEHIDFRVIRPSGKVRWVTSRAVPVRDADGRVYRISGVALDVTERREIRRAREEVESRFRKLVDAAFDAIVISQEGRIREVNRGFLEMFALGSDGDAIGRPVLDFVAPEFQEVVATRVTDNVDGAYDFIGLRTDGTRIMVEVTARQHDIDGRAGRISALRDVTHQRTLEEQFRQAQKMEAVGRLAGGVAHDFNNLLVVISSYAQLIHDELGPHDPRRDDAAEILKASKSAAALTRQLLAFSRQEVIQPREVDLRTLVTGSETLLRRLIGEDVEMRTVLNDTPLTVNVDAGLFEQVMMNLAVNARDAMPTGGKLTIETKLAVFDEAYAEAHWPATPGRFAMVAMSDTGHGMDEATQARIFEPFFTTKEVGKGTGLGLATVYGIVKQSGGFIWVYSEPRQGTTFKVYLPISADVPAPELRDQPSSGSSAQRGQEVILLAEDAGPVRGVIKRILERLGYSVLEAATGKMAIDVAKRAHPPVDLLLTDVVMPEMSGRELAEHFQALCPGGKVLYMSGYTDDAVLRHGVLSSGVEFIQKPFTPESLATKLRAVLDADPARRSRTL